MVSTEIVSLFSFEISLAALNSKGFMTDILQGGPAKNAFLLNIVKRTHL